VNFKLKVNFTDHTQLFLKLYEAEISPFPFEHIMYCTYRKTTALVCNIKQKKNLKFPTSTSCFHNIALQHKRTKLSEKYTSLYMSSIFKAIAP